MIDLHGDYEEWELLDCHWEIVTAELDRQVNSLRARLSSKAETASLESVRELQAEIKALGVLKTLPSVMMRQIEPKLKRKVR